MNDKICIDNTDRNEGIFQARMLHDQERYKKGESDYKKGFDILLEYWGYLPDEKKEEIDRRLKKLDL